MTVDLRPKLRPCRSMLFMPATNERALNKAMTLDVDTLILDMEDSVHQHKKAAVREAVHQACVNMEFGYREVLVRINALDTEHWLDDLALLTQLPEGSHCDGIVVPKVESTTELERITDALKKAKSALPVWIMIESPGAVLRAAELCGFGSPVCGMLVGTADLAKDLKLTATPDRFALQHALSQCVLAARAADIAVIDGVYMNFKDEAGLETEALQGVQLGFDGKSLIHPAQLEVCNRLFAPSADVASDDQALIDAWQQANSEGQGVCVHQGRLVESLHVEQAQARLDLYHSIQSRQS